MVSLKSLFTLGILGVGLLAFTSLGGAGGIGTRIGGSVGGGIRSFSDNIISSFNEALGINGEEKVKLELSDDPSKYTDPSTVILPPKKTLEELDKDLADYRAGQNKDTPQLPDEFTDDTNGGAVVTSPLPQATPIATTFQPQVISGVITPEFASEYTFVAPQEGKLDVSKAFEFINIGSTYNEPNRAARKASDYGGYGSEQNQNDTLARMIETNANKYSEYFS